VRPKWMISEAIRRRGISVGEVSYKGHRYPAEIIAHCVWLGTVNLSQPNWPVG
jgi:hypothetical protein